MLDLIIEGSRKDLGGELVVGRVLPLARRRMVGPFIFLDHMGPADFRSAKGSTSDRTQYRPLGGHLLFDGELHHRDSLGVSQKIRPGEINWMTAGSGIVHSERTDPSLRSSGGLMHGMQAWVALPREDEEVMPAFPSWADAGLCRWRRTGNCHRVHAGARDAARRCQYRPAPHMVEPGVLAQRADRTGKGRLEIRTNGVAA
jgi:redox-sensitive bicupin YhaK (pirin superfamily)